MIIYPTAKLLTNGGGYIKNEYKIVSYNVLSELRLEFEDEDAKVFFILKFYG
jgi:hypothetical protein